MISSRRPYNSFQPHDSAIFHKLGPNCVLFKISSNNIFIKIWFRGSSNAHLSRVCKLNLLKAEDDGGDYRFTDNCLQGQHECSE